MNSIAQFENSASRSRSKHEGESSYALCDRLSRTRDTSQRQLPTDHDYAVSTREYQTDQSSLKPAPAAAGPVLDKRQRQQQRQKQPYECAEVDRVTPYQSVFGFTVDSGAPSIPRFPAEWVGCQSSFGLQVFRKCTKPDGPYLAPTLASEKAPLNGAFSFACPLCPERTVLTANVLDISSAFLWKNLWITSPNAPKKVHLYLLSTLRRFC